MTEHFVPTSPEVIKKIQAVITEMVNSLQRISDEREALKELVDSAAKEYNVKKKQINALAKTAFKRNYADLQAEFQDFEFLYESILEGKKPTDVVSITEDA